LPDALPLWRARPSHDMVISAAGPAASFALGVLAVIARSRVHDPMLVAFLPLLATANIAWAVFNLIPVPPLDGGGIIRNFFRILVREKTAFVISIWIGFIVGALVIVYGIYIRFFMMSLIVAWYLWMNWQQWQYFRSHGFPSE